MMNTRMAFALFALALTAGSAAKAGTLASAPNYGGYTIANNGGAVNCRLFNAGTGTAQILTRQIIDNAGAVITLSADNCKAGLGPSKSCEFDANIPGNFAFACRATYSGTGILLRGVSEVLDVNGNNVGVVPMQ
jgi:hypothetical protein